MPHWPVLDGVMSILPGEQNALLRKDESGIGCVLTMKQSRRNAKVLIQGTVPVASGIRITNGQDVLIAVGLQIGA